MRRILIGVLLAVVAGVLTAPTSAGASSAQSATGEFLVLYKADVSPAAARAAIRAAGGTIVRENTAVGLATVRTSAADFKQAAARQSAIAGVASNRPIGVSPKGGSAKVKRDAVETEGRDARAAATKRPEAAPTADPLAGLQWNMAQIDATTDGSYKVERGDRRVRVGIMDTGVDGAHPDIAPNFSNQLSRNFTVDIPVDANGATIDGPCAAEPDQSCNDPADVDENGHGTHVASIIGSPLNGLGVAGVAPNVTLVNIRAGQDSGYFFLQPTVDALTYAGDNGFDVVNMSFYTDPWLYNCLDNPADSAEAQAEQRTIRVVTQRAINFARAHGVTPRSARSATRTPTSATRPRTTPAPTSRPGRRTRATSTTPASPSRPRPAGSSRSRPSAPATRRPTTPTGASSRPTSRPLAGSPATTSAPTSTTSPRTGSCPPTR